MVKGLGTSRVVAHAVGQSIDPPPLGSKVVCERGQEAAEGYRDGTREEKAGWGIGGLLCVEGFHSSLQDLTWLRSLMARAGLLPGRRLEQGHILLRKSVPNALWPEISDDTLARLLAMLKPKFRITKIFPKSGGENVNI